MDALDALATWDLRRNAVAVAFGKVLREARLEKGFSQEELAAQAELNRTYPSLLERGMRTPTLTVLFALADALGTTAETLVINAEMEIAKMLHQKFQHELRWRLASNVGRRREVLGYTLEDLAKLCGLDSDYVRDVERAAINVTQKNVEALARALGCTEEDLQSRSPAGAS